MIVKNEADILGATLSRIKDHVDEIIVVDTGSTDNTVEIARKYTDKIYYFNWCDDYSKARNFVNTFTKCDYILNLDADELITNMDFFEEFQSSNDKCFLIKAENCICKRDASLRFEYYLANRVTISDGSRIVLFKNGEGCHYEGRVHEYLVGKNGENLYPGKLALKCLNVNAEDRTQHKSNYYKSLSEDQLKVEPKAGNRVNLVMNLLLKYVLENDYKKFDELLDEIFDLYSDILARRSFAKQYTMTIAGLLDKRQYERAKRLIDSYRQFKYSKDDFSSYSKEIKINTNECIDCYIKNKHKSLVSWSSEVDELLPDCRLYTIKKLVIDKKFISDEIIVNAIETAFSKGFDFFEIYFSLSEYNHEMLDRLARYPLNFKVGVTQEDCLLRTEFLHELRIVIGNYFAVLKPQTMDLKEINDIINVCLKGTSRIIIDLNIICDLALKVDYANFSEELLGFLKSIVNMSKEKQFSLFFEGIPLCFCDDQYVVEIGSYVRDIWFLNNSINNQCSFINTKCSSCYVRETCFKHDKVVKNGFPDVYDLEPVNLAGAIKFKQVSHYYASIQKSLANING